jgi:ketosteroid isomerase-like protein
LVNTDDVRRDRERNFVDALRAFERRDFAAVQQTMRSDVVIVLPGDSWISGTFAGYDLVGRCLAGLRRVFESNETLMTFTHADEEMIVRHEINVQGPTHRATMILRVRVHYDGDGKTSEIYLTPSDIGLFDHVANSILRAVQQTR